MSWLTTFGQTISEMQQKMSHPSDLPIQRFVINFSKNITGVALYYKDIKSVTPEKLKEVENVEFLELGFENQSQLNELVSFLNSFKNLKYLSFTYDDYFSKESTNEIIVPKEIANFQELIAVKFAGKWKVNFQKSLETLKKLPKLYYYVFNLHDGDVIPKELLALNVKGISLYSDKNAEIPTWLFELKNLETLAIDMKLYSPKDFRYVDFNKVFEYISTLPTLKSLSIVGLYNLGDSIAEIKIPALEELSIASGEVKNNAAFFKFIGNQSNLKALSLENIKYDTLKGDLLKLKKLNWLNLSGTYKQDLLIDFELKKLSTLTSLSISNFSSIRNFNAFPPKTQSLLLSGNRLTQFPIGITDLVDLQKLELSYNSVDSLPPNIGKLKNLRYLGIQSNQLKYLPSSIGKLNRLEVMNLKANPLKALPANIGGLAKLEKLDISFCDLTALPNTFSRLKTLKKLDASYNFLSVLPINFYKLKLLDSLSLAKNAITFLPAEIGLFQNLRYLNLVSNNLKQLPESFGNLKQLESLNLALNDLVVLPSSFKELISLQTLDLSNTDIKNREVKTKDPFREIYRKDSPYAANAGERENKITALPTDLGRWSKLRKISLNNQTSLGNEALLALKTIPSKGYHVEFENGNITRLPEEGWSNFNVGVLNLRNNRIQELPKDIVNAPFLRSYNFNQNRLPNKPINQNSYAANKYEKLIWFNDFGLVADRDLPKTDSMVMAYVEKSSTHFYRKEYAKSLESAKKAKLINAALADTKLFTNNIGEAQFFTADYKGAIESFSKAILRDTAGRVRIMNFVRPDFTYRAESYLKLGDTLKAIEDYKVLAEKFNEDNWGDIAILYKSIGDNKSAVKSFRSGVAQYRSYIEEGKKSNFNNIELKRLALLELLIIAEDFKSANELASEVKTAIKDEGNKVLFDYLEACAKIGLGTAVKFEEVKNVIKNGKNDVQGWSYELFFKWLRITKISNNKAAQMRELTDLIKPNH